MTWSDNKVRKPATVCLPCQHWTNPQYGLMTDISAFHDYVDLWQSLLEWHLLLSVCGLVYVARMSGLESE